MKQLKKTLAYLLAILMLLSLCGAAMAAEPEKLSVLQCMPQENRLNVILYTDDPTYHEANEFEVTLDNQKMTDLSMSAFARSADYGTSYFIVIDPSTPIEKASLAAMRSVAKTFVDSMKACDNAVVLDTRSQSTSIALSDDKSTLNAQIDACDKLVKTTYLYETIAAAATAATANIDLKERTCLVLLTSGKDDSTLRWTDVEKAVNESFATVYTMAVTVSTNTVSVTDTAKDLGSLSFNSKGGIVYYWGFKESPSLDDITASIRQNENMFYLLGIPLTAETPKDQDLPLTVSLTCGNKILKDSLTVPKKTLAAAVPASTSSPIETPAPQPAPMPEPVPEPTPEPHWYDFMPGFMQESPYLWAGICVVILILLILIIVMLSKGAKKANPKVPDNPIVPTPDDNNQVKTAPIIHEGGTVPIIAGVIVQLTNVKTGAIYEARMNNTLLIGRSGGVAQLAIPDDPSISERQCLLTWRQGQMTIEDQNSTNGTDVNSHINIKSDMRIQVGDSIRMGTTTMVISWVCTDI